MTREKAIKIIKEFINGTCLHLVDQEALETLIPELKESEDERIIRAIIDALYSHTNSINLLSSRGYQMGDIEAWLEKQKEQDNEEGDFTIYHPQKNGEGKYECIPFSFYGSLTSFSNDKDLVDFLNESFYDKEECKRWCEVENKPELPECKHKIRKDSIFDYLCESSSDEKQKEQKPELPKPHKGDDTNPYDMSVSEAQEYAIKRGFGIPYNDGEVYVDERHMTQTIGNILRWADEHPKEQKPIDYEVELKKCKDNPLYFYDKYVSIKQKPAEWRHYIWATNLRFDFTALIKYDNTDNYEIVQAGNRPKQEKNGVYILIKDIKLQSHWKPSEEQMEALLNALHPDDPYYPELKSLYEQLKKLM